MDLIFWRHAEADAGTSTEQHKGHALHESQSEKGIEKGIEKDIEKYTERDMARVLTSRGENQALRMAAWLDRQLPEGVRVLVSPARRCEQTALALGRKYKIRPELAPGVTPAQLLELVQWPIGRSPIVLIGHQPALGQTIAQLLGLQASDCAVKKCAVWWLRSRERDGHRQTVVVTVQSPEVL